MEVDNSVATTKADISEKVSFFINVRNLLTSEIY